MSLHIIYFSIITGCLAAGFLSLSKIARTPSIWLLAYMAVVFAAESIAFIQKYVFNHKATGFIFNMALPFYLLMLTMFFLQQYRSKTIRIPYLVCAVFVFFLCFNFITRSNPDIFVSKAYFAASIFICLSCILYFILLVLHPSTDPLLKTPSFYFCAGLLLLYSFIIIFTGPYPQLITSIRNTGIILADFLKLINIFSYLVIFIGFLCFRTKTQ
jgi:hypothetical protein